MTRIGVISDTHIPSRAKRVPEQVAQIFDGVDLILHAGDIMQADVLDDLSSIAPVRAVMGNCDPWELGLPGQLLEDVDGVSIGMVHDSGPRSGHRARMRAMFPDRRVVVFGHSHLAHIEDDGELLLLNPGTACDPRWGKKERTVAVLSIEQGQPSAQLFMLD